MIEAEEKYIQGTVRHVIYFNEETLYTVAKIKVHEKTEAFDGKEVNITGTLPQLQEDVLYTFYGHFHEHPKYGMQYIVTQFKKEQIKSKEHLARYLSSDLFKGIGKKTAEKIVETLGESAIEKIVNDPAVLNGIPQLNEEKASTIYHTLLEHEGLEKVMGVLSQYGFGMQLALKIYQMYKQETLTIIKHDPYRLIADIEGIGFKRADDLGKAYGISGHHPQRLKAGCLYVLEEKSISEGHVFIPLDELMPLVVDLLSTDEGISEDEIKQQLIALVNEETVIMEEDRVYLPSLFYAEKGVINHLHRLIHSEKEKEFVVQADFYKALGELEEQLNIQYAPNQREAIFKGLTSSFLVLTGGPGTGKTTVIKGIVELYAKLNQYSLDLKHYGKDDPFPIVLVAPTGRAAKRMSESTNLPATTIHRMLGWNGKDFEHNRDNPISGRLLIVDEVSMVDIWLANQLLQSLPDDMQVIFVGDEDQLPSVGPGQVLGDLLASGVIETVRLTDIYRQAKESSIITLAHHIKKGTLPDDLLEKTADRRFFVCSKDQAEHVIRQVCQGAINKGHTAKDIQVLAPMYRGSLGIWKLNEMLQELFNSKDEKKRELSFGDVVYRNGDKVLQLVNNPDSQVFNGDIGEIVAIFYAKENTDHVDQLVISFDGNEVTYSKPEFNQITHAYCCSIHKSQGSEFPIVILPLVKDYYRMLRRNLIYTAITRSKEYLILCGDLEAMKMAIAKTDDHKRYSKLAEKLKQLALDKSASNNSELFKAD